MKRKTSVKKAASLPKQSPAQKRQVEFYRGVKDLSTTEVQYRLDENTKNLTSINETISTYVESLRAARAAAAELTREHETLTSIIEERR